MPFGDIIRSFRTIWLGRVTWRLIKKKKKEGRYFLPCWTQVCGGYVCEIPYYDPVWGHAYLQWGYALLQFNFMPSIWWNIRLLCVVRNNDTENELVAPMWQANKSEQNPSTRLFLSLSSTSALCLVSWGLMGEKAKVLTSLLTLTIFLSF